MKKLYALIGVDCDHDRRRFNKTIKDGEISWLGFKSFYGYFNEMRKRIAEEVGLEPALTLNVRADKQVLASSGSYSYCFDLFESHLAKDFYAKDELAWHHHQWRQKDGVWVQEKDDQKWLEHNINESFEAIRRYQISTLHAGWCFQNTLTMNLYNDLGIKIDYSALPGMFKTSGLCNRYDYRLVAGHEIYIPSRDNYQQKELFGRNKILEIPTITVKSFALGALQIIDNFRKTGKIRDLKLRNGYLNLTVNPFLYRRFLGAFFSQNQSDYFVSFFHSDELLPDEYKIRHERWLYRQDNIYHNIKALIRLARENNRTVEFINFKEFYKIIKDGKQQIKSY